MKIDILAGGCFRNDPLKKIFDYYCQRMSWAIDLQEIADDAKLENRLEQYQKSFPLAPLIALHEQGENLTSLEFSHIFKNAHNDRITRIGFVIGGAEGFSTKMDKFFKKKIAFGKATWPHLIVRILLAEQLYRSHQILQGHPYHRA